MSDFRERARTSHEAIRGILLRDWDPIGVRDVPEAQDEYDSYVGQIYAMLFRRVPAQELVDFLWWVETEHMGLCGNRQHTASVAERLMALSDS
jgi:hypothetical protein